MKEFDIGRAAKDPFGSLVGVHIVSAGHGTSVVAIDQTEKHHMNFFGFVNGGVIFSVADAAMGAALAIDLLDKKKSSATLEIKINYLRGAKGGRVEGHGKAVRVAKNFAVMEAAIMCNGEEVARALGTFVMHDLTPEVIKTIKAGLASSKGG